MECRFNYSRCLLCSAYRWFYLHNESSYCSYLLLLDQLAQLFVTLKLDSSDSFNIMAWFVQFYNYEEKPTTTHIPYNVPPFLTIHCSIGQSDSLKTFPCFTPSPASFWRLYFINMFLQLVQYTTLDDYLWCFPWNVFW